MSLIGLKTGGIIAELNCSDNSLEMFFH